MPESFFQKHLKKALVLDAQERTLFLEKIGDKAITKQVNTLLNNDSDLTKFVTEVNIKSQSNTSVNDFQAGDRINQFIIKRLIAKGGMGSVFLAFDEKLRRNVAIKAIRPEFSKDLLNQERFKREAQILSQINHSAICQIYDSIANENGSLLILEYIEGEVLDECELSDDQMLDVFIQIASALKAAHDKGVIHRDLKPDNILVNSKDEVKILDFGISKSNNFCNRIFEKNNIAGNNKGAPFDNPKLTKVGSLMGTLMYMSPEQANLEEITQKSDVYTFAIIIQQVLTGCSTYNFEDTSDLEQQVKHASIVNTESLPKKYQTLIKSMLRKNPAKRPGSSEVFVSLNRIKNQHKILKENSRKLVLLVFIYIAIGLLLWQFVTNGEKIEKEKIVSTINGQIKTIVSDLQNIYTLPMHDVSQDIEKTFVKLNNNISFIESAQALGSFEKNQFIGKSYLVYGDYSKAVIYLEKAWKGDNKSEGLAHDLSYAYSLEYLKKINKHNNLYASTKPENLEKLKLEYFPKIKEYVEFSKSENKISITNALLLWSDNKSDKAIKMLDEIIDSQDWKFEAYTFKAYFLKYLAMQQRNIGRGEEAVDLLVEALSIYNAAKDRGRSYAKAYEGICRTNLLIVYDAVNRTKNNISENFTRGTKACKNELALGVNSTEVYGLLSKYNYAYSYHKKQKGQKVENYLIKSLYWNNLALKDNLSYSHYNSKAEILALLAQQKLEEGKNPLVEVNQSIEANQKAIELSGENNGHLYSSMIYTLLVKLKYEYLNGKDTTLSIERAQNFYQKGFKKGLSNYTKKFLFLNIAEAKFLHSKAQVLANINPLLTISEIKNLIGQEQEIAKDEPYGYSILASANLQFSQFNRKIGQATMDRIRQALEDSSIANKLLKNNYKFKLLKANILLEMELNKKALNNNYNLKLDDAIKAFKESIILNGNHVDSYVDLTSLYFHQAQSFNDLPFKKQAIENGIETSKKVLDINPNHAFTLKMQALLVKEANNFGMKVDGVGNDATKIFKKAYAINPLLQTSIY